MVTITVRADDLDDLIGSAVSQDVYWTCGIEDSTLRVIAIRDAARPTPPGDET